MPGKIDVKKLLVESAPIFAILIGVALVSFSLGPYQTYDTQMEFEAASNVLKMGVPYVKVFGTVIDQPPLGFYIEAFFFKIFGTSLNTGVTLVTSFGLGSVVLMYLLGKQLYGKTAGFLAAALFGLSPWQLVLSRSFLIDSQCLFLSLLCLFTGFLGIRKGSVKLTLVSGLVFAAAFLTKFFAVFILIPLALFFIYSRPKQAKQTISQLAAFLLPVILFSFLWYTVFLGRSLLSVLNNNNFTSPIPASTHVVASQFFITNFLVNYGVGIYFFAATVFSLVLGFSLRKQFPKLFTVDVICLVTVTVVLVFNFVLGFALNLEVPYISAIKYDFQALPFLVLLVASLATKSLTVFGAAKSKVNLKKLLLYLAGAFAVAFFVASLISNVYYTNAVSTLSYLQYRVEPQVNYGYALSTTTPLTANSPLMVIQYLGFTVALGGFLYGTGAARSLYLIGKRIWEGW